MISKDKTRITITISKKLLEQLNTERRELDLTLSQYIIYLLLKKEERK